MFLISLGRGMRSFWSRASSLSISSAMMSLQSPMHSSQMQTVGPAMSFLTSFCDFPQKEQQRVWFSRLSKDLPSPPSCSKATYVRPGSNLTLLRGRRRFLHHDLVDDTVFLRLAGTHEVVAIGVLLDPSWVLRSVLLRDFVELR